MSGVAFHLEVTMFVVTPAYAESNPTEGTHSETGAHGGDAAGGGVFPPFDSSTFASQLLWLAITFGLVLSAHVKGHRSAHRRYSWSTGVTGSPRISTKPIA
jgi:hypothetical protein